MFARTGARLAYTIELPDDGREFGFLLPVSQAPQVPHNAVLLCTGRQVGRDTWAALRTLTLHTLASLADTQH